jgi:hypothetical protein
MKKDIAIAICVGSKDSTIKLVEKTFNSIKRNIGTPYFKVFICLGDLITKDLRAFVKDYVSFNTENFVIYLEKEVFWSEFINTAIDAAKGYKYFIKSHDDIQLLTPSFSTKIDSFFKKANRNLGWISFTDIGWKYGDFSPSVRPGYFKDIREKKAWELGTLFQFNNFPVFWFKAKKEVDFLFSILYKLRIEFLPYPKPIKKISQYQLNLPKEAVLCHAPFNHFVLIQMSSLKKIGYCENWKTYNALYVDEDWGISALNLNLPNIWLPEVEYFHYRGLKRRGNTRSIDNISKNQIRVEKLFKDKWGFSPNPTDKEIEFIRKSHSENLIPWSINRNSFDWDYLFKNNKNEKD